MATYMRDFNERYVTLSKGVDETIDRWFLMSSPGPVFSIVAVYLLFVLKIGPTFMKNRKPYQLKNIMIVYNAFQVCYSIWMCRTSIREGRIAETLMSKKCEIHRTREQSLALYSGAWFYFFSKIIDLLDTVFFVLRKKQNQVTFLHVYHHTITALFSWMYLKYAPGEQGVVIGILNSGVHIVMYFYYMVAAMGPQYQKYLWWKKYMTSIQLIQFVLIMAYMVTIALKGCNMPKSLTFFFIANTMIFLYLFGNFYKRTYKTKDGGATNAALRAANGLGCVPSKAFLSQGDQMKRLIDSNNNTMKSTKAE
ncbi:elongation of very long chain fatty acids protein 7-like [Musca vetustissima]|uniref:elongation of very long chain fatty acids protein 7-like n=1 Tax=Musca vetustissima TaxID=27455 RepID=UPI002AB6178B|nr:elongation of very long chain fatty acids protein 7-like [Musca vetustissima]